MSEPPPGAGGGEDEHPVDAAARGAHRGPPVPRRPSRWLTWGVRAALLLPAWLLMLAARDVAATPDLPRVALVAPVAALLVVLIVAVGWGVGRPRLTDVQYSQMYSDLGTDGTRRLHRAVWRPREPVPPELRPWVEPYIATSYSLSHLAGLTGVTFGGTSVVGSAARAETSSVAQLVIVALVGVAVTAGLCLIATAHLARRRVRRSDAAGQPRQARHDR